MKKLILPILALFALNAPAQTWADDVACIVYTHCSKCHSPGNIAPFSMMNYGEAYEARYGIQYAATSRVMPPWKADPHFGDHSGKRLLTDAEVALLDAWVHNGAPEGNPADAPTPPVFTSTEEIPDPDLTVQIPTYTLPAVLQNDLYRVFALPATLPGGRFITGLEVVPGNRSVVHHVLVYQDSTGQALAQDAADPAPGYLAFGGIGVFGAKLLGAWVPGSGAQFFPTNMGIHLPQSTAIVVQVHYPASSAGQVDSTRINFRLSDGSLREVVLLPVLNHGFSMTNGPLQVMPNEVATFHEQFTLSQQVTLLSIAPHAHLICTSMKAFGITALGDTVPFVDIPDWDFHWQGPYNFQKPIKLQPLTKLHGYATYDNRATNPHNPNSPPQAVHVGEATTDEMMLFYFAFAAYQTGDEDLVIDTAGHTAHHLGCQTHTVVSGVEAAPVQALDFQVSPNPAGDFLTIEKPFSDAARLRLTDFSGRVVFDKKTVSPSEKISVAALPPGMYAASLYLENGRLVGSKRVVVMR